MPSGSVFQALPASLFLFGSTILCAAAALNHDLDTLINEIIQLKKEMNTVCFVHKKREEPG